MSLKNKKIQLLIVAGTLLVIIGLGLTFYFYPKNSISKITSTPQKEAQAAEVVKKVEKDPNAGIEAIDVETMNSVKKSITTYPGFLVKLEIDRQLNEKYVTQKQHDQLIQMVDDYAKDNKTLDASTSLSSSSSVEISSQTSSI